MKEKRFCPRCEIELKEVHRKYLHALVCESCGYKIPIKGVKKCPQCFEENFHFLARRPNNVWKCYSCGFIQDIKQEEVNKT